jgi:hypothetical protein
VGKLMELDWFIDFIDGIETNVVEAKTDVLLKQIEKFKRHNRRLRKCTCCFPSLKQLF